VCRRLLGILQHRSVRVCAHPHALRWLQTVVSRLVHVRIVCVPSTPSEGLRAVLQGSTQLETLELCTVGCGTTAEFLSVLFDLRSVCLRSLVLDVSANHIHSLDDACAAVVRHTGLERVELRAGANPLDPGATLACVARAVRRCPRLRSVTLSLRGTTVRQHPVGPSQALRAMPGGLARFCVEMGSGGPADVAPVPRGGMQDLAVLNTDPLGFRQICVDAAILAVSLPTGRWSRQHPPRADRRRSAWSSETGTPRRSVDGYTATCCRQRGC
jgi:hypothetical protein